MLKFHLQYMQFDLFFESPLTEIAFNEHLKYVSGEEAESTSVPWCTWKIESRDNMLLIKNVFIQKYWFLEMLKQNKCSPTELPLGFLASILCTFAWE